MDKHELKGILEQICEEDFSEFSDPPRHKFRLKNRIRIRRILSDIKRNSAAPAMPRRFSRRLVTAMLVVILLAAMAITAAAILLLKGFIAKENKDNTQLFAENLAGAPTTIEEVYYIPELPEGYELADSGMINEQAYSIYVNAETGGYINLDQFVKSYYDLHYDNQSIIEIKVNDYDAVYIDHSTNTQTISCVTWDNGYYIMQLEGMIEKDEIVLLAESVKTKK